MSVILLLPEDAANPAVLAYFRDISPRNAQITFRVIGDTTPLPVWEKPFKTIHFDRYLWSDHPVVEDIVRTIVDSWCRGLIPDKINRRKLYATAKIILLNLHRAHKMGRKYWVTYSRNRNVVSTPERYRKSGFSYPHLVLLTFALKRRQLIKSVNGYHDWKCKNKILNKSRPARMQAYDGLHYFFRRFEILPEYIVHDPKQEIIELKDKADDDDKRLLLPYGDSKPVAKMREVLEEYNAFIRSADIKLNVTPSGFVDFSDTTVKRVFNNSSWKQGGRFYGGWWQNIKSKSRHDILINGNPTVELDYKALHPFMLYQRECITWPDGFNPYQLPEYENDPDKKKLRNLAKDLLLICLNAASDNSALMAIRGKIRKDKENKGERYPSGIPDLKVLANRLKENNDPISKHFCKKLGLRLQYLDSRIAERIIKTMTGENKAVLSLHDGFRCEAAYEAQLRELMATGYMEIMGYDAYPEITIKTRN